MNTQIGFFLEKENFKLLIYSNVKDNQSIESFNRKIDFYKNISQKKKYLISLINKYIEAENLPPVLVKFSKRKIIQFIDIKNKEIKISENIFEDYFIFFEVIYTIALYKLNVLGIKKDEKEFTLFFNDIISRAFIELENLNTFEKIYQGHDRKKLSSLLLDLYDISITSGINIKDDFKEHKVFELKNNSSLILYSSDSKKYNVIML